MDLSHCYKSPYEQSKNAKDVVSLVDDLLIKAIECGASDIHFEPTSTEIVIKFRLDGVLNTVEVFLKDGTYPDSLDRFELFDLLSLYCNIFN